jgi:hypothetical protein
MAVVAEIDPAPGADLQPPDVHLVGAAADSIPDMDGNELARPAAGAAGDRARHPDR